MANEMTVQKTESLSNSEAFTNKVLKEFGSNVAGSIQVTDYQRQLIQGYFIATDRPERPGAGRCALCSHGAGYDAGQPPERYPV